MGHLLDAIKKLDEKRNGSAPPAWWIPAGIGTFHQGLARSTNRTKPARFIARARNLSATPRNAR